jgi:acyl-CoA reductase-like NAD-dependent aldehyde dehydrogenase
MLVMPSQAVTARRRNPLDGSVATALPPRPTVTATVKYRKAFKTWRHTTAPRPARLEAADALDARTRNLLRAMAAETGASGVGGFQYLGADMLKLLHDRWPARCSVDVPGSLAVGVRQPAGHGAGMAYGTASDSGRAIAAPLARQHGGAQKSGMPRTS